MTMRGDRLSWSILAIVAVAAPLPFGSVDGPWIALWCIVLGVGLACCPVQNLKTIHVLVLFIAALLAAAFGLVLREQSAVHPWYAETNPLWNETARLLQRPLQPIVSVVRDQPWNALGNPLLGLLSFMAAFTIGSKPSDGRRLLRLFAWAGAVYAGFAIVMYLVDPAKILWREKMAHTDSLTGTFLNRNTAATFFGTAALLWLAILARQASKLLPRRMPAVRMAIQALLARERGSIVLAAAMYLLCMTALFLTRSRAGILLSLAAMVVVILLAYRRMISARAGMLTILLVFSAVGLVAFQTIGAGIGSRIQLDGLFDESRINTYRATWRMISDHALIGTGLGTYELAFPAYRSADISLWGVWNRAHNTWLELASDLGLPFMSLFSAGWLAIFVVLLRGFRNMRDPSFLPSSTAIFVLASIHSLVDYPLQIPGYNLMFWAVVGVALADAISPRTVTSRQTPAPLRSAFSKKNTF